MTQYRPSYSAVSAIHSTILTMLTVHLCKPHCGLNILLDTPLTTRGIDFWQAAGRLSETPAQREGRLSVCGVKCYTKHSTMTNIRYLMRIVCQMIL